MAKKKKPVEEVKANPIETEVEKVVNTIVDLPGVNVPDEDGRMITAPDLVIEPATVSTPALSGKVVRVRNQGAPFPCDLTAYGYGMRWPTNAVYTIPDHVYVELLKQGLNGVSA